MASGRELEAIWEQFRIQADSSLGAGNPLSAILGHLPGPIFELDGPTGGLQPSHASQQTFVILLLLQMDASGIHVLQEIMLPLSQIQSAPLQPHPPGQSAPSTVLGDANQVDPPPSSITPAPFLGQVFQLGTSMGSPSGCPVCWKTFLRPSERNRHVRSLHLPFWLFCPFPGCSWRGNRPYTLPPHWAERHANFGEAPKPEDCRIYNPDLLVQSVVSGELLVEEMTAIALQAVRIRAQELDRVGIWEDEWGRGQRVRR